MLSKHYFYRRWRGLGNGEVGGDWEIGAGKLDCYSVNVLRLLAVVLWKDKPSKLAQMTFPRVLFIFWLHFCGERYVLYMKHPGYYYIQTAVAFRIIQKRLVKHVWSYLECCD